MKICVRLLLLFFIGTILPVSANAFPDKRVTIQPIHIVYGTNLQTNPSEILFEAEMDKIWGQAGIDIEFLAFNQWLSPGDFSVGLNEFPGFFSTAEGKNADNLVINMWFIGQITYSGFNILGISNPQSPSGIAISDIIFGKIPNHTGVMAFDVIAHELGHMMGLDHIDNPYDWSNPSENPYNLMSTLWYPSGSSISDIPPEGSYNLLSGAQILTARNSPFARDINTVPEPATLLLIGFGLGGLAVVRKKLKK